MSISVSLFRSAQSTGFDVVDLATLASAATSLGVAGLALAWLGYVRTSRAESAQHMHGLFRDYLKLRIENAHAVPGRAGTDGLGQIIGFKLYTLEEMFFWTWRRCNWFHRACWNMPCVKLLGFVRRQRDEVESWQHTIAYHLCSNGAESERTGVESKESLVRHNQCYSLEFLAFAHRVLGGLPHEVDGGNDHDKKAWELRRPRVEKRARQQADTWPITFRPCDPVRQAA